MAKPLKFRFVPEAQVTKVRQKMAAHKTATRERIEAGFSQTGQNGLDLADIAERENWTREEILAGVRAAMTDMKDNAGAFAEECFENPVTAGFDAPDKLQKPAKK